MGDLVDASESMAVRNHSSVSAPGARILLLVDNHVRDMPSTSLARCLPFRLLLRPQLRKKSPDEELSGNLEGDDAEKGFAWSMFFLECSNGSQGDTRPISFISHC